MNSLTFYVMNIDDEGTHYVRSPGIDFGGGPKGTTLVAWLPDGIITRTRGAKCWNGIGMGSSSSPANITRWRWNPSTVNHNPYYGTTWLGAFDEVDDVEYGRHYKRELAAMLARAGVATDGVTR